MKRVIVFILTCITLQAYSQNKKDSIKTNDSVVVYQVEYTQEEFNSIVNKIKVLDEKPSVLNDILTALFANKVKPVKIKK